MPRRLTPKTKPRAAGGRARLLATGCMERTSFLLRTEESYESRRQGVLMIGRAGRTALEEEWLRQRRPVMTVLEASQQALGPLVLVGKRELLERIAVFPGCANQAGFKSVFVLEPLVARCDRVL